METQAAACKQVAVLDGSNQPVQAGKIGEVCIRGPNVTAGYLNNPAANKEAFAGKASLAGQPWIPADSCTSRADCTGSLYSLGNCDAARTSLDTECGGSDPLRPSGTEAS